MKNPQMSPVDPQPNQSEQNLSCAQRRESPQPKSKKQYEQFLLHEATKNINSIQPNQLIKQLQIKKQLSQFEIGQLMYLMFYILNYPSLAEAHTHALASRLGGFDVKKENQVGKSREYCKCCGYVKQDQVIPLCTAFDSFPSVGISTYLFFETIKNLILLLIFLFLVHGLYALITNLYTAQIFTLNLQLSQVQLNSLISWMSLDSKVTASNINNKDEYNLLYMIEMWIGVGLVILWSLFLYLIRYYQRKYEVMVDKETISAADFSVIIEGYPREISQAELQRQLNLYAEKLQCQKLDIFHIQTISMSAQSAAQKDDEEEMEKINQQYNQMLDLFADWVCELQQNGSLPATYQKRSQIYQKFQRIKNKRLIQNKKILRTLHKPQKQPQPQQQTESFQNNNSIMKAHSHTNTHTQSQTEPDLSLQQNNGIAIVTFKYSNSKDLISKHNSMDFAKTIRHFLRCCPVKNRLILVGNDGRERKVKIQKAPEPEDIKWENLSVSRLEKFIRKAGTYIVTLILLSISFTLVYLLSIYESKNKTNQYLNFAVSLLISLINFIIGFLIRFLTIFQKDYTQTGYQTSLAIKSIWAQLLNSIVVPIIVNYIIQEKNIFGESGLSTDVIYLAITNSFLPPLTKLIDPYHKYIMLRGYYYRRSLKQRLLMKQIELNQSQELVEFQTGYEYIYFINLYLFTSYFVTLQPCISVFAIAGMFLMYWIQKYSLMNRMKRPVPGTDLVNTAMSQMINLGPIFFSIGALCWSHLLDGYKVKQGVISYYVPNILAASLAALFFIFPFNVIFDKYLPNQQQQDLDYQQCRVLLNSQYDRTNPATIEQAIKQYEQYLQNLMQQQQKKRESTDGRTSKNVKIKVKSKKQLGFNLGEKDQEHSQDKEKDKVEDDLYGIRDKNMKASTQAMGKMRNLAVDKLFLSRKKEVLRNRTKIQSKIVDQEVDNLFDDDQVDEQASDTKKQVSNKLTSINNIPKKKTAQKQYTEQPKPKKIQNEPPNFFPKHHISKTQKKDSIPQPQPQPQPIPIPIKQKQDQYKIKKQKQEKAKKVNIDFRAFLPLENTDVFFQNSPENPRDDSYMNFFAKKLSMGSEITDQTKENSMKLQRRTNNPYEKAFH